MSKINKNKVPWIAVLVQSAIAALLSAIIFVLAPVILLASQPGTISTGIFDLLQAATTVIWCISMVILFVDVIVIRHKYQEVFARIRLVPDWVFYLCSVVGAVASMGSIAAIFTASWTQKITTTVWDGWIIGITIFSFVFAGVVFYIGQKTIESNVSDQDIIEVVTR